MRFFAAFFILTLIFSIDTSAQTTGTGCNLGSRVYTQYLGMDNVYGGAPQRVYANPGTYYDINFNGYSATKPNNENYVCGQINTYPGPVPRNDITTSSTPCVTEVSLHGPPNGNGFLATYKVNDPSKCGPTNVPIDQNYIFIPFTLIAMTTAGFALRKRGVYEITN
ncbi:hypothetical protein INP83_18440 [Mucilaginibacter sp. 21P]|uniref:hypothetical protein n=1 Tax=Mucilaginibacter sp. 21P TaxID=2778902 RepID=UPI001C561E76|nr:hypothetical protein [Mucilaginibacter sp. 21P]QXV65037.1 hypothetical protein INP83_18440 [Mucilaginibacter sp. 21P]